MTGLKNPSLTELAAEISKNASLITEYLLAHNLPSPSFAADGPQNFPVSSENLEIQGVRLALIEASRAMLELAVGPLELLTLQAPTFVQFNSALGVVNHFNIAEKVPPTGDISFEDLSASVGLDVNRLQRVLRVTSSHRVFAEPKEGHVCHTAASNVLLDPDARAWIGHQMEEIAQGATKVIDTFQKYPHSDDVNQTALAFAFDGRTYWDFLDREPWRVKRFADALRYVTSSGAHDIQHIVRGYEWSQFGNTTLVDVGGSSGRVAVAIARVAPSLNFIVQDLPELAETANAMIPSDLRDRMRFEPHDFFKPQPIKDARVYMYRQILHDWPDSNAIEILHALIPALADGDTLLLVESILPPPNSVPNEVDRLIRAADFLMMQKHNSMERTVEMWIKLLKEADERFEWIGVVTPLGSSSSVIEVRWRETTPQNKSG